jgi:large subunit ribosomal protein L3
MQYWPRKRAKRIYPNVHWHSPMTSKMSVGKELRIMGFAGWKAGMTHVQYTDPNPKSPTSGKIITKPVTVLDCPPLFVCGVRFYSQSTSGLHTIGEKWSDKIPKDLEITKKTKSASRSPVQADAMRRQSVGEQHMDDGKKHDTAKEKINDVRLIVATQPKKSGMAKKKPDVFELGLGGEDINKKHEFAETHLGKELSIKDVFRIGEFIDATAVTKGHGFTGPVKRFGIRIQTRKDKQMHRHVGSIGSTVPRKVDWRVPAAGQHGFHTRTEYNKRVMMIGDDANKVNPKGGFLGYGVIPENFILVEGSIPGSRKRLVILRKGSRAGREVPVDLSYISVESKQGK